jgi:hypothetical protein
MPVVATDSDLMSYARRKAAAVRLSSSPAGGTGVRFAVEILRVDPAGPASVPR